ncbi:MAG: ABC transporter substrate-binding protein, partial [Chloroflexota bacterium]
MNKRTTHVIAATFALIILTLLSVNLAYGQAAPVFRIGVLDDQQGHIANGARLAVHDINALGGVRGADGTQFQLELIVQPISGTNITNTIASLRDASLIAVLGPESDSAVKDNLAALQALNVPVLTPATGDTTLTQDQTGRLFRTRAAQLLQGRALATVLINDYSVKRFATVQLDSDLESAAGVVGFTISLTNLNVTPQVALQVLTDTALADASQQLISNSLEAVVAYGDPTRAGKLLTSLRTAGFKGQFVYNQADDAAFQSAAGVYVLGTYAATTWPLTAADDAGRLFRDKYIQLYAALPGPIEAASYDAVTLLSAAINKPGELQTNLTQLDNIGGVQGTLLPAQLQKGETSNNVAVVQLGEF